MEIAQQAVLADPENRILILKRPEGKWQFPGGRMNLDESWENGLRREVLEETSISIITIESVMMVDNWVWQGRPQYGVYFFCRTLQTKIKLSREHLEYCWIKNIEEAERYDYLHPILKTVLGQGLQQANGGNLDNRSL